LPIAVVALTVGAFGIGTTEFVIMGLLLQVAADILTRITGFSKAAVSPILLVFGVGLSLGNFAGGRLADRGLPRSLVGTLVALAIVLVSATGCPSAEDTGGAAGRLPRRRGVRDRRSAAASCGCSRQRAKPAEPWRRASTSPLSISAMRWVPGPAASPSNTGQV
jgi:MFS family permease